MAASTKILTGTTGGDASQDDWTLDDNVTSERTVTRYVSFSEPFASPPRVVINLIHIDAQRYRNAELVTATDVTRDGFNARFYTWHDSITHALSASWIAIGQ